MEGRYRQHIGCKRLNVGSRRDKWVYWVDWVQCKSGRFIFRQRWMERGDANSKEVYNLECCEVESSSWSSNGPTIDNSNVKGTSRNVQNYEWSERYASQTIWWTSREFRLERMACWKHKVVDECEVVKTSRQAAKKLLLAHWVLSDIYDYCICWL